MDFSSHPHKKTLIESFGRLRPNAKRLIPFMVNLSSQEWNRLIQSLYKQLIVTFMLFCLGLSTAVADKTVHILIVTNGNETPYQDAVTGYTEQLSSLCSAKFTGITLAQAQKLSGKDLDTLKPDLIYALGNEATLWAAQQKPKIPVVSSLILTDDIYKQKSNVTGINLAYPLKTQFQWLKKFFPVQKSVAVLYNPAENAEKVELAKQISQQENLLLVTIPVKTAKELPYALEQLTKNIEILLAIPDETVLSVHTAKEVLLASFRNKVPLIGLSDNWVKSGALYALSWDYTDIGKQSAAMSHKILKGAAIKTVPPEYPRKITYTINAKIAAHMDIEIPDDLLKNAKTVFN